ncbi:hypothetical protein ACFWY6_30030 [Streptomyces sp. NPDC059037]|uniref:hypothetical protein n=1 Tax=Streptomyces sp. NPDC059037 TaxID=3346710 RepID=UPI003690E031
MVLWRTSPDGPHQPVIIYGSRALEPVLGNPKNWLGVSSWRRSSPPCMLQPSTRMGRGAGSSRDGTLASRRNEADATVTEEVYRKQIRPVIQTGAIAMDGIFGTPTPTPPKP